MTYDARTLDAVFETIQARIDAYDAGTGDPSSRTHRLLQKGPAKIAQKVGEEAVETVIEGVQGNKALLIEESGDLLYHLMVLWGVNGVTPADVWQELATRHGLPEAEERQRRA